MPPNDCAEMRVAESNRTGGGRQPAPRRLVVGVLLIAVAIVVGWVYRPVLGASAIWVDDQQYVTDNPLVLNPSWGAVKQFLSEVQHPSTVMGYYQPLTMISLMLDSATGGGPDRLRPFHRTSLALHIINTTLVIVLLILLFEEPYTAAMVGLLFGVHPLTVEPVSWIADRKTLLATFFALGALIAYVKYTYARTLDAADASRQAGARLHISSGRSWYAGTAACYALALLSKPTSTPLPILFLLLDYWPLRRLDRGAVLEKIPFLVLGSIASAVTILSQQSTAIIQYPGSQSSSAILLAICYNVVFYLWKMVWPVHLFGFYLRPDPMSLQSPMLIAGVVGTLMLLLLSSISLLWTRALLTGWLFYLVALLPTMGVLRVATVIVAEKYAYLPSLGLMLVLAWLLARCWSVGRGAGTGGRPVQAAVCVVALALGAAEARATRRYLTIWHDSDALYGYVQTYSPRAWYLQSDFGDILAREGNNEEAAAHYLQAEADEKEAGVPPHAALQQDLGNALLLLGRTDEAIAHYKRALALEPADPGVMMNLGVALDQIGKSDEAIAMFRAVLRANPTDVDANDQLGRALAAQGNFEQAVAYYRAAVQLKPDFAEAHVNLADTLQAMGHFDEAIAQYRVALQLDPNDPGVHNNLAAALTEKGMIEEAITHLRTALRLNPALHDVQTNLSEALARRGLPEDRKSVV
jgi:protein O-mannosyl-transferase